jgi:hypothetical protein
MGMLMIDEIWKYCETEYNCDATSSDKKSKQYLSLAFIRLRLAADF